MSMVHVCRFLFALVALLCTLSMQGQTCPTLLLPLDGSTAIDLTSTIRWNNVDGVTSFIVSLGTTPGGTDIIDRVNVGNATSYSPPLGLPETTQI